MYCHVLHCTALYFNCILSECGVLHCPGLYCLYCAVSVLFHVKPDLVRELYHTVLHCPALYCTVLPVMCSERVVPCQARTREGAVRDGRDGLREGESQRRGTALAAAALSVVYCNAPHCAALACDVLQCTALCRAGL